MAIAIVALLAFGGSYAYFTAEANQTVEGSVTTATVQLNGGNKVTLTSDTFILPGATILEADALNVVDKSNVETWIFAKLTVEAKKDGVAYSDWEFETDHESEEAYAIAAGEFAAVTGKAGYYSVEGNAAQDTYSFGAITLNENLKGHSVDTTLGAGMNISFTFSVEYFSCQKSMGADAATALTAYLALNR